MNPKSNKPWMTSSMTEDQILKNLVAGGVNQAAALEALYANPGKEFGRFFMHRGVNFADAEDLLQEAVIKILKGASSFNGRDAQSPNPAKAWMWQITRNALSDHFSRCATRSEQSLDEDMLEHIPIDLPDQSRAAEDCVTKGLARFALKDQERAYVLELVVEGVDGHEIANRINRSYDATRQYLTQCRQHIRPFIENCLAMLKL